MRRTGRISTAVLALLILLSGLLSPVWAVCAACKAEPATPMPGCHEPARDSGPALHPGCCGGSAAVPAESCCGIEAAAARGTAQTLTAPTWEHLAGALPSPLEGRAVPDRQEHASPVHPQTSPPHAGVDLYVLHSVYLI